MITQKYCSPLGEITIYSDGEHITGLYFSDTLKENHEHIITKSLPVFEQASKWLDIYFSGKAPNFTPPIKITGSDFQRSVSEIILDIPFGKTSTYSEIAGIIAQRRGIVRMSAQAVGGAVGHNPISIIVPCHRVIGINGALTGYGGGLERKRKLLELEGIDTSKLH